MINGEKIVIRWGEERGGECMQDQSKENGEGKAEQVIVDINFTYSEGQFVCLYMRASVCVG